MFVGRVLLRVFACLVVADETHCDDTSQMTRVRRQSSSDPQKEPQPKSNRTGVNQRTNCAQVHLISCWFSKPDRVMNEHYSVLKFELVPLRNYSSISCGLSLPFAAMLIDSQSGSHKRRHARISWYMWENDTTAWTFFRRKEAIICLYMNNHPVQQYLMNSELQGFLMCYSWSICHDLNNW